MERGTCPVCEGTHRVAYQGEERYKSVVYGYDSETNTVPCNNCGGQYMYGRPLGTVPFNKHGVPCAHSYKSKNIGRCLTEYTCEHCDDTYSIDSGD